MKTTLPFSQSISTCMIALLLLGGEAQSQLQAQSDKSPPATSSASGASETPAKEPVPAPRIRFRPPVADAPPVRVTGGSRGAGDELVKLDVLTPDGIGLTTQEQPSLFWYQSRAADAQFELTLLQDNEIEPLVQVNVKRAATAGIQRVDLKQHQVKLAPQVEYQWVVALIVDPNNRSRDVISSGVIKRIADPPGLKDRIAEAAPSELAGIYAEAGLWYDALAALSDQIESHPKDSQLHSDRSALLKQVGLDLAAKE